MTKTTYKSIVRNLVARRAKHEKWLSIGKDYPGVSLGTLCRIAKDPDYEPKDADLRLALGLHPLHVTVSPLACGHAPSGKRCAVCHSPTKYAAHPVMRRTVVDRGVFAALGALYANRGVGEALYRLALKREFDAMTG